MQCLVDFSSVGLGRTIIDPIEEAISPGMRFMLPPKLSTDERVGLATVAGAVIYNTTTNKLQVYAGTTWRNLH